MKLKKKTQNLCCYYCCCWRALTFIMAFNKIERKNGGNCRNIAVRCTRVHTREIYSIVLAFIHGELEIENIGDCHLVVSSCAHGSHLILVNYIQPASGNTLSDK